jgi:hypothetical protein
LSESKFLPQKGTIDLRYRQTLETQDKWKQANREDKEQIAVVVDEDHHDAYDINTLTSKESQKKQCKNTARL